MNKITLILLALSFRANLITPTPIDTKKISARLKTLPTQNSPKKSKKSITIADQLNQEIDLLNNFILKADKPSFAPYLNNLKKLLDKVSPAEKTVLKEKKGAMIEKAVKDMITVTDDKKSLSGVKQLINDLAKALGITLDTASIPDPIPEAKK